MTNKSMTAGCYCKNQIEKLKRRESIEKGIAIIEYNSWGNAHIKNRYWYLLAPYSGELEDYHTKKNLINQCIKNGWKYKVLRHHRNNTISILETNLCQTNKQKKK